MNKLKNAALDFNELSVLMAKEYEAESKQVRKLEAATKKRSKAKEKQIVSELAKAGMEGGEMEALHKKQEAALEVFLKNTRKALIDRKQVSKAQTKQDTLLSELSEPENYVFATQLGTFVKGIGKAAIKPANAQRSQLAVFPANTALIEIKDSSTGSGTGWGAVGFSPEVVTVLFRFTPQRTAMWNLSALISFDGFYILRADDGILTRKYAQVTLTGKIKVYQYAWQAQKTYTVFNKRESEVEEFGLIGTTESFNTSALLRAGDPVVVRVDIALDARAQGSGSYAELNFEEGTANYIIPALLIAN